MKKTTLMLFLVLGLLSTIGDLRAEIPGNLLLLAYKDELQNLNLTETKSLHYDVSKKVFFYLYTRGRDSKQLLLPNSLESLQASNFNLEVPTKLVIHGFLDNSDKPMAQSIKDNLLLNEEVNVVLVDWGQIAIGIDYIWIAKKTRDVGAYTARLIDFLVQQGVNVEDIHLIGHSLGAHVAGFAGGAVKKGKVGRITGLDPAKPGFHKVPPGERLDPSNAKFVDCIHTCSGILGLAEPICTADFYPNGGVNTQPGCHFFDFGRCSHLRAHRYFAESIDPEYKYPSLECDAVPDDSASPSRCSASPVIMGYLTDTKWVYSASVRGIYFVTTNSEPPYAPIHP